MSTSNQNIPQHLLEFLRSPNAPYDAAVDALEEWILQRRSKGATLFELSIGLAELEDRTPPFVCRAFDRARYATNVPQPSDLTPPTGPFPLARSQSVQSILHHLLSSPTPSLEHSREVILEYVLARETRLRDKKPGRGGKGTLGRDGLEEISKRLGELEDGLRGVATATSPRRGTFALSTSPRRNTFATSPKRRAFSGHHKRHDHDPVDAYPSPVSQDEDLDEARTMGLALILSLRLTLSYFTLQELADQLLKLAVSDAERTLVQHVRRRVQGEGRYGVGQELEYVESLIIPQRPSLRPVFRSARIRTHLPPHPRYAIALPAPSKSACIKLLQSFIKSPESVVPGLAGPAPVIFPDKKTIHHPKAISSPISMASRASASPRTPMSTQSFSPTAGYRPLDKAPIQDAEPLKHYATELVSEYLTREKRDYMLKGKWAKSGRDQLGKDLGDIESSLCLASKSTPSQSAETLLPVFLVLRRTFALPSSPLPDSIIESYIDQLPAPPDPDEEPFREPTVQSTTVALYQNPRLEDNAAMEVLEELIENEREQADAIGVSDEEKMDWLVKQIDSVKKRFPDGSYDNIFSAMTERITNPSKDPGTTSSELPLPTAPFSDTQAHRRTRSNVQFPMSAQSPEPPSSFGQGLAPNSRVTHIRSISMPMRSTSYDDTIESGSGSESPGQLSQSTNPSSSIPTVDQDSLLAVRDATVFGKKPTPEPIDTRSNGMSYFGHDAGPIMTTPLTATPASHGPGLRIPNQVTPSPGGPGMQGQSIAGSSPGQANRQDTAGSGGWWDVISAVEPHTVAPWHEKPRASSVRRTSISSSNVSSGIASPGLPLPPGAEPATIHIHTVAYPDVENDPTRPPTDDHAASSPRRGHYYSASTGSVDRGSSSSPRSAPIRAYAQPDSGSDVYSDEDFSAPMPPARAYASSPTRSSPLRSSASPGRPTMRLVQQPSSRSTSNSRGDDFASGSLDMAHSPSQMDRSASGSGIPNFSRPTFGHHPTGSGSSLSQRLDIQSHRDQDYDSEEESQSPSPGRLLPLLPPKMQQQTPTSGRGSPIGLGRPTADPYTHSEEVQRTTTSPSGTPIWATFQTSSTTPIQMGRTASASDHVFGQSSPIGTPSTVTNTPIAPTNGTTPGSNGQEQGRSRLFSRGRNLTSVMKGHKDKNKDRHANKENEKEKHALGARLNMPGGGGKKDKEKEKEKEKHANNPGKWNRDMVADIMGKPAERR